MAELIEPKIADFNHRISLCTMYDVVEEGGVMSLTRRPVATIWASIYAQPHLPSFISPYGFAIKEQPDRLTHLVTIRYKVELDFTSAAWLYEERLKGPPRWFKVTGFYERPPWIILHTHLVERSVNAIPPVNRLASEPTEI